MGLYAPETGKSGSVHRPLVDPETVGTLTQDILYSVLEKNVDGGSTVRL